MSLETATKFVGPFAAEWCVCLDGYRVPSITAMPADAEQKTWTLCLDHRFMVGPVPREEIERWLWFVANAMAIGAGRSCFGENGKPIDPYGVRMMGIEMPKSKPDLRLVKDDAPAGVTEGGDQCAR